MRITVTTSGHIPSQWAHSINIVKHANAFLKLGHDVQILSIERFLEQKNKNRIRNIHRFYGIADNIKIKFFKDNTIFYFEEIRPFGLINYLNKITKNNIRRISDPERKISEYCKKIGIDICYCRRARRVVHYNIINKIPTVVEEHTPPDNRQDIYKMCKLSHSKYFKIFITTSELLKQNFIDIGVNEDKILVLQNGVDIESFQNLPNKNGVRELLGLPESKKIVIYSGSLFPDKGIEHILSVAKNLPKIDFLLLGGRRKQIEFWIKYAFFKNIKNVRFQGFVENSDIPLYLKAADALIMPYKTDQKITVMDINTTSPLKLFEYMASKKPIISTNIPAISRTITHGINGLLAEANDIKELTEHLRIVLEDDKLAENLAKNAYDKVKEFDIKKRCKKIISSLNNDFN